MSPSVATSVPVPDVSSAPSPSHCIWCGRAFTLDDTRGLAWVNCTECGVASTSPWPSRDELDLAYSTWYRPSSGRFGGLGDRLLERTRGTLARRVAKIAPNGPVLDVGAGTGALVSALRQAGRAAVGLERPPDPRPPTPVGVVASLDGPPIVLADVSEVTGPWAGIIFWHSLEHLAAPGDVLDRTTRLLCAGGVMVIAVPNHASFQSRVFGGRWFARDIPRHLAHIPGHALVRRLEANGLSVRRVSYLRGGQVLFGWLDGLVGSLHGSLRLYDAIRAPEARAVRMSGVRRAVTLVAATVLSPVAFVATVVEVAARRGGTIYVEAFR